MSYSVWLLTCDFLVLIFTGSEEAVRAKIDSWNEPVVWQDVMAEWNRKNVSIIIGQIIFTQLSLITLKSQNGHYIFGMKKNMLMLLNCG